MSDKWLSVPLPGLPALWDKQQWRVYTVIIDSEKAARAHWGDDMKSIEVFVAIGQGGEVAYLHPEDVKLQLEGII